MSEVKDCEETLTERVLLGVAKAVVILISVLMIAVTMAQVVFRYLVEAPLPWSEELARYCFVWIVFLGAAIGLSRGVHLGVDLLVNQMPERIRKVLAVISNALIVCFAGSVIYASVPVIKMNMFQHSPALGVQMSSIYLAIPISMGLIALIGIQRIFTLLRVSIRQVEG